MFWRVDRCECGLKTPLQTDGTTSSPLGGGFIVLKKAPEQGGNDGRLYKTTPLAKSERMIENEEAGPHL